MNLDEAIQHCEEVAESKKKQVENGDWEKGSLTDDAISRQEAMKAIEALQRPIMREESNYYQFKFSGMSEAREVVENLPSVTPQQRTGRWIDADDDNAICGCCNRLNHLYGAYCKHCGAKMEVE